MGLMGDDWLTGNGSMDAAAPRDQSEVETEEAPRMSTEMLAMTDVRTLDDADPNWAMCLAPSGHYVRFPTRDAGLLFWGATPDKARAVAAKWARENHKPPRPCAYGTCLAAGIKNGLCEAHWTPGDKRESKGA